MHTLPFAEDIRDYIFPSFSASKSYQPTEEQSIAADSLVDNLTLSKEFLFIWLILI